MWFAVRGTDAIQTVGPGPFRRHRCRPSRQRFAACGPVHP